MLNSNKVSEIKIIVSGLLQDLDSLSNADIISPLKWEELNIAADNIKQKINTLMIEHERYNLVKLHQTIAELKRSFSDIQLNVSKSLVPRLSVEKKLKLRVEEDEEEMELFYDGRTSILDAAKIADTGWISDMPGPKVDDLNAAITLNDKLFFIKGLFNEDEEQYRLSIQKLNDMLSMDEALEYTRTAFPDWDEESNIIYRFYMILRRKFDA